LKSLASCGLHLLDEPIHPHDIHILAWASLDFLAAQTLFDEAQLLIEPDCILVGRKDLQAPE
jgi:hypothetical protein